EFLHETLQKPALSFWIGLWVPAAGTGWTWVNGSHLDQDRWTSGSNLDSLGMVRGSTITPENCDLDLQRICQREAIKL
ncbi:KLRBA protein, partial [Struthidea cinerea]|nr:KLRBA protein [Struthidea cinerea]